MKPTNTELSQQFSEGKFASCYDYLSDKIQWKVIGNKTLEGKEDVIKFCENMLKESANTTFKNSNMIVENNNIVVEGNCKFMNEDNSEGEVNYCDVFQFEGDKISKITSYCI
jgi:predicted SnoaL-like aldol condensation-catalyzing enzyme